MVQNFSFRAKFQCPTCEQMSKGSHPKSCNRCQAPACLHCMKYGLCRQCLEELPDDTEMLFKDTEIGISNPMFVQGIFFCGGSIFILALIPILPWIAGIVGGSMAIAGIFSLVSKRSGRKVIELPEYQRFVHKQKSTKP